MATKIASTTSKVTGKIGRWGARGGKIAQKVGKYGGQSREVRERRSVCLRQSY